MSGEFVSKDSIPERGDHSWAYVALSEAAGMDMAYMTTTTIIKPDVLRVIAQRVGDRKGLLSHVRKSGPKLYVWFTKEED